MSTPEFNNQGGPEEPGRQNPQQHPWGPPAQQQAPGQQSGPQGSDQAGPYGGAPYGGGQRPQYAQPSQPGNPGSGAVNYGQQTGAQPGAQPGGPQPGPDYGRPAQGAGYPAPGYAQSAAPGRAAAVPQPEGGKALLGPLTLRDVLVLVAVVLLLVGSSVGSLGRLGFIPNLEFLGLGLILPLAVGIGFVIRRVSPSTKLRLGSFSLDQLASVLASLALLSSVSQIGVLPFLGYYGYINWTSVILGFVGAALLFVTTVLARFIPVFAADFTGRPEAPAHVVARDAVPANRPVQPVHSGPAAQQQYPSTPGYGNPQGGPAQGGVEQGAASPYAPQGYQPQQGQPGSGWAAPAAASGAAVTAAAAAPGATTENSPAEHGAPAADDGASAPSASRHRAPESSESFEGSATSEGSAEASDEGGDAGSPTSSATSSEPGSSEPVSGSTAAPGAEPESAVTPAWEAGAAAGADDAQSQEQSAPSAVSSDPIVGDEVVGNVGDDATAGPSDDDLLKEAQSHVAEAPELPEPVLGVPTLNEQVEEPEEEQEEFFTPHPDDDSDVTVLRSALSTGGALNTGAGSAGADAAEPATAEGAAPAGATSDGPIHAVVDPHRDQEQPAQQAFWFAVPERRVALDERSGTPVFDLLPGKWILALQEGPQGLVVQNEDGRIGVLHDLRNIERGS